MTTNCISSPSWSIYEGQTEPALGLIWPVDDGYLDATTIPIWTAAAYPAGSDTLLWSITTIQTQVGTATVPSVTIAWAAADLGSLAPGDYILVVTGTDGADVTVIQQVEIHVQAVGGGSTTVCGATACCWPVIGCCDTSVYDPEVVANASEAAVEILYALSGRQFGLCTVRVRPCRDKPCGPGEPDAWSLVSRGLWSAADSVWFRGIDACCGRLNCGCAAADRVRLWHRDACDITEVQIDGETLDPTLYRLHRQGGAWWALRTDGETWPTCQDWTVDDGEEGSWSIEYTRGRRVPTNGQMAAGRLSCEIAKACTGDATCALPERVQTITRQGVTVGFLDPQTFLSEGRTGITTIDLWLRSVNPAGIRERARLYAAKV